MANRVIGRAPATVSASRRNAWASRSPAVGSGTATGACTTVAASATALEGIVTTTAPSALRTPLGASGRAVVWPTSAVTLGGAGIGVGVRVGPGERTAARPPAAIGRKTRDLPTGAADCAPTDALTKRRISAHRLAAPRHDRTRGRSAPGRSPLGRAVG